VKRDVGVTRQMVLDCLILNADLDGLVTVTAWEIGELLGIEASGVSRHVRNLAADGMLTILGQSEPDARGYMGVEGHPMNAIQLAESVLA
jgi:predicted ArsR family transcriptional regulator